MRISNIDHKGNILADIVTTEEFARRLDISIVTLLLWERKGAIPPARRLSAQNIVWHRVAVETWFSDGMPKVEKERKTQDVKAGRKR